MFSDAGHFLHEDIPLRTADASIDLWRLNDREAIKRVVLLNRHKALPNVRYMSHLLENRVTGKLCVRDCFCPGYY